MIVPGWSWRAVVNAAADRVEPLAETAWPFPVALALLELSDAFAQINEPARANAYRQRALAIGTPITGMIVRVMMFHSLSRWNGMSGWILRIFCVPFCGPSL